MAKCAIRYKYFVSFSYLSIISSEIKQKFNYPSSCLNIIELLK